jgi:hypothetical protein
MTLILAALVLLIATVHTLPFYDVPTGTHEQTGYAIGVKFADKIRHFLSSYDDMSKYLRPFADNKYAGFKGNSTKIFLDYVQDTTAAYPAYVQELQGISKGASVDLRELWLLNLEDEIMSLLGEPARVEHCSDVLVNFDQSKGIGHNEDGDVLNKDHAYMTRINNIGEPSILCKSI